MRAPARSSKHRCGLGARAVVWLSPALLLGLLTSAASAAESVNERALTPAETESWLDASAPTSEDTAANAADEALVPPPPPRHHGIVAESTIGAFGQLGDMKHISPVAPWFRVQLGYEPFHFLMLFAEGDLVLADTSYAHPPPPPRTYALWGFGAGLRGTVKASERVGLYLQASVGGAEVNDDVLGLSGYRNANKLSPYFGGELGVEWYQVNPHLALALHGGLRDYTATFKRDQATGPPLAWVSGVALRYAF